MNVCLFVECCIKYSAHVVTRFDIDSYYRWAIEYQQYHRLMVR